MNDLGERFVGHLANEIITLLNQASDLVFVEELLRPRIGSADLMHYWV